MQLKFKLTSTENKTNFNQTSLRVHRPSKQLGTSICCIN